MKEESVNLNEVDDLIEHTQISEYPCLVIDGITTENEYIFFNQRTVKEEDKELCLPLYFNCEDSMVKITDLPMTLDSLLMLRNIGDYTLSLHRGDDDIVPIDLNDSNTLIKFIKL